MNPFKKTASTILMISIIYLLSVFNSSCFLKPKQSQKNDSSQNGFLIQQNPDFEQKRIYWIQSSQNKPRDLCMCSPSKRIVGNNIKEKVCTDAHALCVDFNLFSLKFEEQANVKHLISIQEAEVLNHNNQIAFLTDGISEIEEEIADNLRSQNNLVQNSQLAAIKQNSLDQIEKHKKNKKDTQAELDFVRANEAAISGASKQVTSILVAEGQNFNLGPWSKISPNTDILSFVSKMVFQATSRAFAEQQTPPEKLSSMLLHEAFKIFTLEFKIGTQDFHPNQLLLLPKKNVVGAYFKDHLTTQFRDDDRSSQSFESQLKDTRACLLSRSSPLEGGIESFQNIESPLTVIDSLSDEMASAMVLDKNQQTLVINCGFVSNVIFSNKTYANFPGNEKDAKKSVLKINLQGISLSKTALLGQETGVFTLGDFLKMFPESRILYSAKK